MSGYKNVSVQLKVCVTEGPEPGVDYCSKDCLYFSAGALHYQPYMRCELFHEDLDEERRRLPICKEGESRVVVRAT